MYAITGVTGHVGGHAAEALLAKGERVRAVVRSAAKGDVWAAKGADVVIADMNDADALTEALSGCEGVFVLLPVTDAGAQFHAQQRALADAITGAVASSGVPHVVALSSVGAELDHGTGPILPLHHFENSLRSGPAVVSVLRSAHFQEKVTDILDVVRTAGIYPNFGESADVAKPMNATADIGAVVAETLLSPPVTSEIVDLEGPSYTEREVAQALAAALGKPVEVVNIPREGWVNALVDGGVPNDFAEILAQLYDAEERGILRAQGDRVIRLTTPIEETVRRLLEKVA
ncbi:NmrA family NAD(P)-binding protein [Phytoactinopolyspora alkaliphila]|uniref:NmrA family NAD(P)-binding protein n=1 Tax=Phytoactinopolyspora alkaliphila TaxID=1783498 RepID=A0A6N9YL56_9ACTN|nr:NmrA family NAD(P)-binding protein [Phytoactinopolyspora alkaliphila]NED95685.1 NmrA family NAD(P)-binding protein [Phytoactinopolyspora alkaliphila]